MGLGRDIQGLRFRGFPKLGVPFFGGPHNKDSSILGSILRSPSLGKLPHPNLIQSCFFFPVHIARSGLSWDLGITGQAFQR